jgi:hypothetical protein
LIGKGFARISRKVYVPSSLTELVPDATVTELRDPKVFVDVIVIYKLDY